MNILCFGDSNTHGFNPKDFSRYPPTVRFTGILQRMLPHDYIIEEGLSGRTTVFRDPLTYGLAGIDYMKPCLMSHKPIDLIIVMLGTNDTKERFAASAEVINLGLNRLIQEIKHTPEAFSNEKVEILIIAPLPLLEMIYQQEFGLTMGKGCVEKSQKLVSLYSNTSKLTNCYFLDPSPYASCSEIDSTHLSAETHQIMAQLIYEKIVEIKENKKELSE